MFSKQFAPWKENRVLAALPPDERDHVLLRCKSIQLGLGEELYRAGEAIPAVYFPATSFISLMSHGESGVELEVGMIGYESMLGASLMLDETLAPFKALVQGAGTALRLETPDFLDCLQRSPTLGRVLMHHNFALLQHLGKTLICIGLHSVESRLARWLLMADDRARSAPLHLTHSFLATMLGVRRAGITRAAHHFKERQLIQYHRGVIRILDRAALEAAACTCYQAEAHLFV